MLKGEFSKGNHTFVIRGEDTLSSFEGELTSSKKEDMTSLVGGFESDLTEIPFVISNNKIKYKVVTLQGGNWIEGLQEANVIFAYLGALFQHAKRLCDTKSIVSGEFSEQDVYGLTRKAFDPFAKQIYKLKGLGEVHLVLGRVVYMSVKTSYGALDIEEVNETYVPISWSGVLGYSVGFRCDSESLGIDVVKSAVNRDVRKEEGVCQTLEDVIALHPEKQLKWLRTMRYHIVTDDTVDEVIESFMQHEGIIAFDTETTGLRINFKSLTGDGDYLVGIVLSKEVGEGYYFPLRMKRMHNLCDGDHYYVMEKYFRKLLETKELVVHNASFDWKVAYLYGIVPNIVHDTMSLMQLTLVDAKKIGVLNLKALQKELLGLDVIELSDLVQGSWGDGQITFDDLSLELVRLYACADTDGTLRLLQYAQKHTLLETYGCEQVYNIEVVFSQAVGYQEFYGHHFDVKTLPLLREDTETEIVESMGRMRELLGDADFNPSSPQQLQKALYTTFRFPAQYDRVTGRLTTNKTALAILKDMSEGKETDGAEFIKELLRYREYTGVSKLLLNLSESLTADGYGFSSVYQYGAITGRVSTKSPNYQSYNNAVKKHVTPRPGYGMADADFSAVELRVMLCMANEREVVKKMYDPEFDIHAFKAAQMYGVPIEMVTKEMRQAAKAFNFGLPYGMGDSTLGFKIHKNYTADAKADAKRLRGYYFKDFPHLQTFFKDVQEQAVADMRTATLFGRARTYTEGMETSSIRRYGGNHKIQGTAADIYKLGVGNLFKRLVKEHLLGDVLMSSYVHDEVLLEYRKNLDRFKFLALFREEFQPVVEGWCPLYTGFGFGRTWYEAKSVEVPVGLQDQWIAIAKGEKVDWIDANVQAYGVDEFCDYVPKAIKEWEARYVEEALTSKEQAGRPLSGAVIKKLLGVVQGNLGVYTGEDKKEIEESLVRNRFQEDFDILVGAFCNIRGVDRERVTRVACVLNEGEAIKSVLTPEDKGEAPSYGVLEVIAETISLVGVFIDEGDKLMIVDLGIPYIDTLIKQEIDKGFNENDLDYVLCFFDRENKKLYETKTVVGGKLAEVIMKYRMISNMQ